MELRPIAQQNAISQQPRERQTGSVSDYSRVYDDPTERNSDPGAFRRYSRVIYVNFFFMVLEVLGGSLAKSVAVISEGSMLTIDILTSFVRICGAYSVDRRENADFNFGYRRVEPIGIVLETVLVWFSMVLLLIFSYYMYMTTSEDKPLRPLLMLATAAITLVGDFSRVVAVYGCGVTKHLLRYPWLSKAERENTKVKKGTKELSLRRIMETVKGSLIYDSLVFVFAVLICADPRMLFLDKLSIFFLIAIVFYSTLPNFKRNVKILMEGNLRPAYIEELKKQILEIDAVLRVESIKVWVVEESYFAANVHISVEKDQSPYPVNRKIGSIMERFKISYWAVQVWPNDGLGIPLFRDAYLADN